MPTTRTQNSESASHKSTSARRADSTARNDIIAMLKDDHKRVKKAFREFDRLDADDDREECQAIVVKVCNELKVHATLEEEFFYPVARRFLGEEDLIDEAEVEHMTLKVLIEQLEGMKPGDDKYSATFTVLAEYVKHHVKEEENDIFPRLSRARFDWQELKQQMEARREALTGEPAAEAAPASRRRNGG